MIELRDLESKQCDTFAGDEPPHGWSAYALEPKYDGFRIVSHIPEHDPGVEMYTRSMKRNEEKLPYVCEELREVFPPGTVLDGEIVALQPADGDRIVNDFEHVQSIMLSKPQRAIEVAEEVRPLDYIIFDLLFYGGADLRKFTYTERRRRLELAIGGTGDLEHSFLTRSLPASIAEHDRFYEMGFEGSIIKNYESTYENGARGKGWFKIKPQASIDAIIVGFTEGEGKYVGKIGSIRFAQPDPASGIMIERGTCSGMTDELRDAISKDRDDYINKVIEVAHMGTYKGSVSLRHPQFKRFRDDKLVGEVEWHDR